MLCISLGIVKQTNTHNMYLTTTPNQNLANAKAAGLTANVSFDSLINKVENLKIYNRFDIKWSNGMTQTFTRKSENVWGSKWA